MKLKLFPTLLVASYLFWLFFYYIYIMTALWSLITCWFVPQGRLLNLSCSTVPTFVLSITATTQVTLQLKPHYIFYYSSLGLAEHVGSTVCFSIFCNYVAIMADKLLIWPGNVTVCRALTAKCCLCSQTCSVWGFFLLYNQKFILVFFFLFIKYKKVN